MAKPSKKEDSGQGGTAMGRTTGLAFGGSTRARSKKSEGPEDTSSYKEMKGGHRTGAKGGAGKGGSRGGEGGRGAATRPAFREGPTK